MHTLIRSLIATAICVLCSPSSLLARDVLTVDYQADVLPEDDTPSWYRRTEGTVQLAEINPPGVLHLLLVGDPDYNMNDLWSLASPIPGGNAVVFVEIRMQVLSADRQDYVLNLFYDGVVTRIRINDSAVGYFDKLGPSWNYFMDTTDDFHAYRLEMYRAEEAYKFYVDGVLMRSSSGVDESPVGNTIRLGNFGPDWDAELLIDYIRAGIIDEGVETQRSSWGAVKAVYQ